MMRSLLPVVSWLALAGTVLSALLVFHQRLDLASAQRWMLMLTFCWFAVTPFWVNRRER
jgi:hypothetical protein